MNLSDELLKNCIKQDRRAQYELYNLCFNSLMNVCSRYEKNEEDAAALLNLGFLKICQNIDKYNTSIPFKAWVRRIMINTVIDEFRKNKKRVEATLLTDFSEQKYELDSSDYNLIEQEMSAEEAENMLNLLPEAHKTVFNLYEIDGYNHKEIAEMLAISERTSKRHLAAAKQGLKEKLVGFTKKIFSIAL